MPSKEVFLKLQKNNLPAWRSNGGDIVDHRVHDRVIKVIEL